MMYAPPQASLRRGSELASRPSALHAEVIGIRFGLASGSRN